MAFDITDPINLLELKNEVANDPISMGYAAVVDQTNPLLKLLNDPDNNIGAETAVQEITPEVLIDVIDVAEYGGNQVAQGDRDWVKMVFDLGLFAGADIEKFRTKIKGIFPTNGITNTNIDNLVRPLSRAEVLFGAGTAISKQDWFVARDS